jgi:hypothetical protein
MVDLLEIEKRPSYDLSRVAELHLKQLLATRDFFACCYCLRIPCASHFSNAMMKGKRRKHSQAYPDKDERHMRFRIDCGIRYGRYQLGAHFAFGGLGSLTNWAVVTGLFARISDSSSGPTWLCTVYTESEHVNPV